MRKEWQGFKGTKWQDEVDVREFIQNNYTPYDGDESFMAEPTEATEKLWGALQKLQKEERAKGGVLDMVIPILSLILFATLSLLYCGGYFGDDPAYHTIGAAFGNTSAGPALVLGSFAALVVAFIQFVGRKLLSLKDYFGRQEQLKQDLEPYHAFWVIGGNTFALRKAMQLSGFDAFLKVCSAKKDYLYGGYSAGICVLAPNLKGLHLVDEPVNPYNQDEVIQEGVGLLEFLPLPHYQSDHPESVLIDQAVSYCKEHQIAYQTLSDGDVIQFEI